MTRDEILKLVEKAINIVMTRSGREEVKLDYGICPIDSLPDFTSLRAVEVVMELSDLFDCDKLAKENLFVGGKNEKMRGLYMGEIVDKISILIS